MIYNSPLYSPKENLEVAIGAIEFKDKTITNLRAQINALRFIAEYVGYSKEFIDTVQYAHLEKQT